MGKDKETIAKEAAENAAQKEAAAKEAAQNAAVKEAAAKEAAKDAAAKDIPKLNCLAWNCHVVKPFTKSSSLNPVFHTPGYNSYYGK